MSGGMSPINSAFTQLARRAERDLDKLPTTFVDAGIVPALTSPDHQIVYGRRGTGKTHVLRYLMAEELKRGGVALYVDLRSMGSPEGLFGVEDVPRAERAQRLFVDLLQQTLADLPDIAKERGVLAAPAFAEALEAFAEAVALPRVPDEIQQEVQSSTSAKNAGSAGIEATPSGLPKMFGNLGKEKTVASSTKGLFIQKSALALNFRHISESLRQIVAALGAGRVLLLLDEWSSVQDDLRPLLAEMIKRTYLTVPGVTLKVAALEHRANFQGELEGGRTVGLEPGADIFASANLDNYLVFEVDNEASTEFFGEMFAKHITSLSLSGVPTLTGRADLTREAFTDRRAFDELVRAAEGVPRDAINIAATAAMKACDGRISVSHVRKAARSWYTGEKESTLDSRARDLLAWIMDNVIREKKARAFLVDQNHANDPLLRRLFDARVLHIHRRGYSAQDIRGQRFDVWGIDYGAYIDLANTKNYPNDYLPGLEDMLREQEDKAVSETEVPKQDLRSIRRAVLRLEDFYSRPSQMQGDAT